MQLRHFYLALVIVVFAQASYGQGCSDAGFCTAGAMQSGITTDTARRQNNIGISFSAGAGENGTSIFVPQVEGALAIGRRGILEGKLPFSIASGNLGKYAGIGDPIVTYSRQLSTPAALVAWTATAGLRIGINDANAADKGRSLPMPYQSGLGTTDIIAGAGAAYKHWLNVSIGYQQPLFQYNNNGYMPSVLYPSVANDSIYFASRKLRRKGDLLLRAEAGGQWHSWAASAGPLLIYHLGEDNIETPDGRNIMLKGSEGLTLNLSGTISYIIGNAKLQLVAGTPFVVRDYRPDGLTRAWVITVRYTHTLR